MIVHRLKQRDKINVVFMAMSVSMWRYQYLYDELRKNSRFNVSIIILPCITYAKEQQDNDVQDLICYFKERGCEYILGENVDIKAKVKPDILFYPQPYDGLFNKEHNFTNFKNCLLCYYPYAFWSSTGSWSFNLPFHNFAWKLFYSTTLHLTEAKKYALNKARNVEIVGYPNGDRFLLEEHTDVWKKQECKKKRIIWAPHFTIFSGGFLEQSNFLLIAYFMLECSKKFSDRVQFVFKPHPRLFTELCKHEEWGKEKAQEYYNEWSSGANTQLQTGDFIDLFMTSDAMIHDCSSFSVEYHYTRNPVMYIANNFEEQLSKKPEFGQLALLQHYVGKTHEDIISFIEDVVIGENDPMKSGREGFYTKYLIPPYGKTVAENTVNILLKELS